MRASIKVLFLSLVILAAAPAEAGEDRPVVTVVPMPTRDILPSDQDLVLASLARQLRATYSVEAISGRAVGRAVWGTLGSGLEESAATFLKKIEAGKKAYGQLQIAKAQEQLREGLRLEETCGAELREVGPLSDVHVYLGLVALAQGRTDEASDQFRKAVAHDSQLALSTKRFPPDVVAVFEKAKRQLLSGKPTDVGFQSRPSGATVFLDGQRIGQTPLDGYPVFPGHHFVRLELEGYSPWTVNLPDGAPQPSIKGLLVPAWAGAPPEELGAVIGPDETLDEGVMAKLRLLAGFFQTDALLLVTLTREGANLHLGERLFVVQPEALPRARMFNLGSNRAGFDKKITGVVSTLDSLRTLKARKPAGGGRPAVADAQPKPDPPPPDASPRPAVATRPPKGGEGDDFIPLPPSGAVRPAEPDPDDRPPWARPLTKKEREREEDRRSENAAAADGDRGGGTPWYKSWWFWTITGVVVAGGATGLTLWLVQPESRWTLVVQP